MGRIPLDRVGGPGMRLRRARAWFDMAKTMEVS